MQRFYTLFSAVLLTAFIALVALKIDSEIIEHETTNIEEVDLKGIQDDETEEIQFQLKDFNQLSREQLKSRDDLNILVSYSFAIKSNTQKVSSPPPEV